MAVRSTGPLLSRLRDLMKLKYLGEPIQGYIVLSEDAHQVNFIEGVIKHDIIIISLIFRMNTFLKVMDVELSFLVLPVLLVLLLLLKTKLCYGQMVATLFKLNNR